MFKSGSVGWPARMAQWRFRFSNDRMRTFHELALSAQLIPDAFKVHSTDARTWVVCA